MKNQPRHAESPAGTILQATAGWLGLLWFIVCLVKLQPAQFNVVTYEIQRGQAHNLVWTPSLIFLAAIVAALVILAARSASAATGGTTFREIGVNLSPLILTAPIGAYLFLTPRPWFAISFVLILSLALTAYRAAGKNAEFSSWRKANFIGYLSLAVLVIVLTIIHTRIQLNFFNHFMLGHADIGHYLEEMKNCLAGRGLRTDSFDFTRLGWHFSPLLFAMVPGYWLFPTPTYWMVFGAFVIHAPALIAYRLAHHVTRSVSCAVCWGLAWLLLPSMSRLVYCNTYGFQWTCAAIPLLACTIYFAARERWLLSCIFLALVLLVDETRAAATLGWGVYLFLFSKRRRSGVIIAVLSIAYLFLCVKWFIPYFADGKSYQRFDLFGDLGASMADLLRAPFAHPHEFFGRLTRVEGIYFLALLSVSMTLIPLRAWRLCIAAVPGLLLILLLANKEYLSVKFWHHSTVLPFLFFAGLTSLGSGSPRIGEPAALPETPRADDALKVNHYGWAAAVLFAAAMSHYFFAFSPISHPYDVYANTPALHQPDPRLAVIQSLRSEISKDKMIWATERLAAHFTDYRRLYTGIRPREADYVIIDRSDTWDQSGLPKMTLQFESDPRYRRLVDAGAIVVFERVGKQLNQAIE